MTQQFFDWNPDRSILIKDLDSNYDGYVNEKEFLAIFAAENQQEMSRYFSQDLDTDHDGKLDLEELSIWIDPKDFVPGKYLRLIQNYFDHSIQILLAMVKMSVRIPLPSNYSLDTVAYFLIKLGIKPCMHLNSGSKHFFH